MNFKTQIVLTIIIKKILCCVNINMLLYFRKINDAVKSYDEPVYAGICYEKSEWVNMFNKEVVKDFLFGWYAGYPRNTTAYPLQSHTCIYLFKGEQPNSEATTYMKNDMCFQIGVPLHPRLCQIPTGLC